MCRYLIMPFVFVLQSGCEQRGESYWYSVTASVVTRIVENIEVSYPILDTRAGTISLTMRWLIFHLALENQSLVKHIGISESAGEKALRLQVKTS